MKLNIKDNLANGGKCCKFEVKGKRYYADKCNTMYTQGPETMIFEIKENGDVDWHDLYCDRTDKPLETCIKEFIRKLNK